MSETVDKIVQRLDDVELSQAVEECNQYDEDGGLDLDSVLIKLTQSRFGNYIGRHLDIVVNHIYKEAANRFKKTCDSPYVRSMEIILTTSEIRAILKGCQQTLRLVRSTTEYRQIESSEYFSTSNDVVLNDAVSALGEIDEAIGQYQQVIQQTEV
jgi:hypothetical protein